MSTVRILIDDAAITIQQPGGVNVSLPADHVDISIGAHAPTVNIGFDRAQPPSRADRGGPGEDRRQAGQPSRRVVNARATGLGGGRGRGSASVTSAADYIESVFRRERRPLTTSELAQLVPETTAYSSSSENIANNLRIAMKREPDRFEQLDASRWFLRSLLTGWHSRTEQDELLSTSSQEESEARYNGDDAYARKEAVKALMRREARPVTPKEIVEGLEAWPAFTMSATDWPQAIRYVLKRAYPDEFRSLGDGTWTLADADGEASMEEASIRE